MMETALVFDREGKTIHWHEPPGRSAGSLPDSRSLWDILWENRERLGGVAHTHPWQGSAIPSGTDLSTFDAVERALGRSLLWPVVTFNKVAYVVRDDVTRDFVYMDPEHLTFEIEGIAELRVRSGSNAAHPA